MDEIKYSIGRSEQEFLDLDNERWSRRAVRVTGRYKGHKKVVMFLSDDLEKWGLSRDEAIQLCKITIERTLLSWVKSFGERV